jgi:isocitrate/isopropylmalate dehydrogenase
MIGSIALMLEKLLGLEREARLIWDALAAVLAEGYRTPDLIRSGHGERMVKTHEFGDLVERHIKRNS